MEHLPLLWLALRNALSKTLEFVILWYDGGALAGVVFVAVGVVRLCPMTRVCCGN